MLGVVVVVVADALVLVEVEGVLVLVGNVGHVIVTGGAAVVVVFVVFAVDEDDDDDDEREDDTDGWIGSITGKNEKIHEILLLISYTQRHHLNMHVQLNNEVRRLRLSLFCFHTLCI